MPLYHQNLYDLAQKGKYHAVNKIICGLRKKNDQVALNALVQTPNQNRYILGQSYNKLYELTGDIVHLGNALYYFAQAKEYRVIDGIIFAHLTANCDQITLQIVVERPNQDPYVLARCYEELHKLTD